MNSSINTIEVITFFFLFFGIALSIGKYQYNKQIKKNTHESANKHNNKFIS